MGYYRDGENNYHVIGKATAETHSENRVIVMVGPVLHKAIVNLIQVFREWDDSSLKDTGWEDGIERLTVFLDAVVNQTKVPRLPNAISLKVEIQTRVSVSKPGGN